MCVYNTLSDPPHQRVFSGRHETQGSHIVQQISEKSSGRSMGVRSTNHHVVHVICRSILSLKVSDYLWNKIYDFFSFLKKSKTYIIFHCVSHHSSIDTNKHGSFLAIIKNECSRELPQMDTFASLWKLSVSHLLDTKNYFSKFLNKIEFNLQT